MNVDDLWRCSVSFRFLPYDLWMPGVRVGLCSLASTAPKNKDLHVLSGALRPYALPNLAY